MAYAITSVLGGCGSLENSMYASGASGYSVVDSIDGSLFEVVASVARTATAITNISPDMDFEENQTYLYKNGEDEYFLFNMSSIVMVAQKGTKFDISNEDRTQMIQDAGILGVWFSPIKKNLEYSEASKNGTYKLIATVKAEVAINADLYRDFVGKIAIIDDGQEQWSIFIGNIGDDYKDLDEDTQDAISYMASTLNVSSRKAEVSDETEGNMYVVNDNSKDSEMQDMNTEPAPDVSIQDTENQENTGSMLSESIQPESNTVIETGNETDEVVLTEPQDESEMEAEIESQSETKTEAAADSEVTDEQWEEASLYELNQEEALNTERKIITLDNQKKKHNSSTGSSVVQESSVYNLLTSGERGYASVICGKQYVNCIVEMDDVYRDETAVTLIKRFYNNGAIAGNYFEPQEGTSWEVAHYKIEYPNGKGYVDAKFCGMDGNALNYRGIKYSQKTYTIKISDEEYYCYYAVPTNCREYVIAFGEGTPDNTNAVAAYYKVSHKHK